MEQTSTSKKKKAFLQKYISNPKERQLVTIVLSLVLLAFFASVMYIAYSYTNGLVTSSRSYKGFFKELGSIARIGFFAALAIYPIFFLLKWKTIKNITIGSIKIRPILQFVGKYVRKWHVPVAITATGIALIHGLLALLKGFKWDFTTLSGITNILILLSLLFMGLKRYKKADKNFHFYLAIAFLAAFMIHATFA